MLNCHRVAVDGEVEGLPLVAMRDVRVPAHNRALLPVVHLEAVIKQWKVNERQ